MPNECSEPDDLRALADTVVDLARSKNLTLLTVESCTAGALACAIAESKGSSNVLHGGYVVYTKTNKSVSIGVPAELMEAHTAVSAPVARAMATGGLSRGPADIAVAITGVAGPDPDEDGNPVGLTFIAAAQRDDRIVEGELRLSGDKQEICHKAMVAALRLAKRLMS